MPSKLNVLALRLLETQVGRYALLVALLVDIFAVPPLVTTGALAPWTQATAFSITLLVALYALRPHGAMRALMIGIVGAALAARWAFLGFGAKGLLVAEAIAAVVATAGFALLLLQDAFSKGKFPDRLLTVLLAYILVGAAWAEIFGFLDILYPGALQLPGGALSFSEFIYFSFSTLTSLGYGDIVPVHPMARSLAVLEALTGQIFLVAIVSRFVRLGLSIARDSEDVAGKD